MKSIRRFLVVVLLATITLVNFLAALHRIQADYPYEASPIRTALVTARGAPAHERVVHTLRAWNIRIDEALFLGGLEKSAFLSAFGADIFFDDQHTRIFAKGVRMPDISFHIIEFIQLHIHRVDFRDGICALAKK